MSLWVAAWAYVETKKSLTTCQQRHFEQLCSHCYEYAKCPLYSSYIQLWQDLQAEVAKGEPTE